MKRTFFALVPLIVLFLGAGATRAQTVTVAFEGPGPESIETDWKVYVDYTLPPGTYDGLRIDLELPDVTAFPALSFVSQAAPVQWTHTSVGAVTHATHRWTAGAINDPQGVSGRIIVFVRARLGLYVDATHSYYTRSGTPFPFNATFKGNMASVPFQVSNTAIRTATGTATIGWQYHMSPYRSLNAVFNGKPAFVVRYDLRAVACGNAPLEGTVSDANGSRYGLHFRVNLGANLHLVNAWWGDNSASWPRSYINTPAVESVGTLPIAYGQPGHTAGGSFDVRWNRTFGVACAYTDNFYVDIAFPCDEQNNFLQDSPANHLTVDDPDAALAGDRVSAYQVDWDGTVHGFDLPAVDTGNPYSSISCGGDITTKKYYDVPAEPGTSIYWIAAWTLPRGAVPSAGALLIDALPLTVTPSTGLDVYNLNDPALATTTFWACDLHGESPTVAYFDNAAFGSYKSQGKCLAMTAANPHRPPESMARVTHIVADLPDSFADPFPQGDAVLQAIQMQVDTTVPSDQASDYTNCAQYVGGYGALQTTNVSFEPSTSPNPPLAEDDPAEDCASRSIALASCPYPQLFTTPKVNLAPGECAVWDFRYLENAYGKLPINTSYVVHVPAGIELKDVPGGGSAPGGVNISGTCAPSRVMTASDYSIDYEPDREPGPLDEATDIRIDLGSASTPCATAQYGAVASIEFCVDSQRAWTNGQALKFTADAVDASNIGTLAYCANIAGSATPSRHAEYTFLMAVPPEMRAFVSPLCLGGNAVFVVEGKNSGGVDLTTTTLVFDMPAQATFAGAEALIAPVGSVVQVSANGSGWVAVGELENAQVRYVRLSGPNGGFTLPAVTANRASLRVSLTPGGGAGSLAGVAHMRSAQLTSPANGAGTFVVGSCQPITLSKFADLDSDGVKAADEPALRDWPFTVTTDLGGLVGSGVTGADGEFQITLPAGSYVATETLPVSGPSAPTWNPTSSNGFASTSRSFDVTATSGAQTFAFGNDCSCADQDTNLCTERACVRSSTSPVAAASDYTCGDVGTVDCGGNACSPNVCDPTLGCVPNSGPAYVCDPVTYFLPVRDTVSGKMWAIRCDIPSDGEPVCVTENGQLKLFPDQGGACGAPTGQ